MYIETDRLMALVQTGRQGLKQDSLTSIVSTSGGCTGVAVELRALRAARARWLTGCCMRIWSRVRARFVNKLVLKFEKSTSGVVFVHAVLKTLEHPRGCRLEMYRYDSIVMSMYGSEARARFRFIRINTEES
jgi:hypothetical protein